MTFIHDISSTAFIFTQGVHGFLLLFYASIVTPLNKRTTVRSRIWPAVSLHTNQDPKHSMLHPYTRGDERVLWIKKDTPARYESNGMSPTDKGQ